MTREHHASRNGLLRRVTTTNPRFAGLQLVLLEQAAAERLGTRIASLVANNAVPGEDDDAYRVLVRGEPVARVARDHVATLVREELAHEPYEVCARWAETFPELLGATTRYH